MKQGDNGEAAWVLAGPLASGELRFTAGAVQIVQKLQRPRVRGVSTRGRQQRTFSARSQRRMRYEFSALPWSVLGPRLVLVTLTVPNPWRDLIPTGRELHGRRDRFRRSWRDKWHESAVGAWRVEFQPRLWAPPREQYAPHLHLLLKLPDRVSDSEFEALQARRRQRHELEREYGKREGRRQMGQLPKGEFCDWLLDRWTTIVCGKDYRRWLICDVTPVFWTEKAYREADDETTAKYLFQETGKASQAIAPEKFGGLSFYGTWGGRRLGFKPVEERRAVTIRGAWLINRELRRERVARGDSRFVVVRDDRWAVRRPRRARSRGRRLHWWGIRRQGQTMFVKGADTVAENLYAWATSAARERRRTPVDAVVEGFFAG